MALSPGRARGARAAPGARVRTESMIDRLGRKDISEGMDLWDKDYLLGALRLFQCKAEVAPPFEAARCLDAIGEILTGLDEPEEAAEHYELAAGKYGLIGKPTLSSLMECKAKEVKKGAEAALAHLDAALDRSDRQLRAGESLGTDPAVGRLYHYRGMLLSVQGEQEQAIAALDAAISLRSDRIHLVYGAKGDCLSELDRPEEALRCYKAATDSRPCFVAGLEAQARCLADLGRRTEARSAIDAAMKLHPKAQLVAERAFALSAAGRDNEAIKALEDAVKAPPCGEGEEDPVAVLYKAKAAVHADMATAPSASTAQQGTAIHAALRSLDAALAVAPMDQDAHRMKDQVLGLRTMLEEPSAPEEVECQDRVAQAGDVVLVIGADGDQTPHGHRLMSADGRQVFVLHEGESALVVAVSRDGDLQLRNNDGVVSGYADATKYKYETGGRCLRGRPKAPDARKDSSPPRALPAERPRYATFDGVPDAPEIVEQSDRVARVGDLVNVRSDSSSHGDGTHTGAFYVAHGEAVMVVSVDQRTGRFKLRNHEGIVSEWQTPRDFQFEDGGYCLAEGEHPRAAAPAAAGSSQRQRKLPEPEPESPLVLSRIARVGDHVQLIGHDRDEVVRDSAGRGVWVLRAEQDAMVVEVDGEGDFRLRNDSGAVSEFVRADHYRFSDGLRCSRGAATTSMRRVPVNPHRPAAIDIGVPKTYAADPYDWPESPKSGLAPASRDRIARVGDRVNLRDLYEDGHRVRAADGTDLHIEHGEDMLVVQVEGGSGRFKVRGAGGRVSELVDPNMFQFDDGGLALRLGQAGGTLLVKPVICKHVPAHLGLPMPLKSRGVPVSAELYAPASVQPDGSPVRTDRVDAWQRRQEAQGTQRANAWIDSDDESPSRASRKADAVQQWQQRMQRAGTDPASGWASDDERQPVWRLKKVDAAASASTQPQEAAEAAGASSSPEPRQPEPRQPEPSRPAARGVRATRKPAAKPASPQADSPEPAAPARRGSGARRPAGSARPAAATASAPRAAAASAPRTSAPAKPTPKIVRGAASPPASSPPPAARGKRAPAPGAKRAASTRK